MLKGLWWAKTPLFRYQKVKTQEMFHISYVFTPCLPDAEGLQLQMFPTNTNVYLKIILNKCQEKVKKTQPPTCGRVTDNEPNNIN